MVQQLPLQLSQPEEEKNQSSFPRNKVALKIIEEARDAAVKTYAGLSTAAVISAIIPGIGSGPAAALALTAYAPLHRVSKYSRIALLMKKMMEAFQEWGQEAHIYPCIEVDGQENLDFFIHVPQKANFLISIRSQGKAKIVYDKDKESLFSKRRRKGRRIWRKCPLLQMPDYKKWLTKNRGLFGFSSREVRKTPLTCIVVLWQPTYLADHEASFYSKAGEDKILTISKKGKVFLVERKEIIKVMKAYLANEIEYQQ